MARPDRRGRLRLAFAISSIMGLAAILFAVGSRSPDGSASLATAGPDMAPSPQSIDDGFEVRDVQTRAVAIAMLIGVAVIVLSIAGLVMMLQAMHARDAAGPPLTAQQTAAITPPGPALQAAPLEDIATLRKRETATLTAYRWLGPDHVAAQIPISRAMQLVVGASLDPAAPVPPAPNDAPAGGGAP